MSFISILKKFGSVVLGIEQKVAPLAESFFPQFAPEIGAVDGIVTRIQTAITTVEANNPGDGQGGIKASAVIADFEAGLGLTNTILAAKGETVTYDSVALNNAITSQVAAYNAFAALKASLKVVAVSTASPVTKIS